MSRRQSWSRSQCFTVSAMAVVCAAAATPREALAQRQVQVNVDSVPQGAQVRLDSETATPVGTTPLRRTRIRAGSHTLYFTRDGFLPSRLDVTIGRRNETFTATLTQGGSVYVSADVDGAQVFLDGNAVGSTPGRINNVQPGQHVIEIRQQGMTPFRDTVTVGPGAVASVNATMRPPAPTAPPTGTVRVVVTNPNGAPPRDLTVTFDGTPMQGNPPAMEAAQPGQHIVQVSATGFRTERREITVTAGQASTLAIDLAQNAPTGGTVRVLVPTGAQAFLDGEALAGTPPMRDNVPPGQHTLRIMAPGRQPVIREITVTAGQTTALEIGDLQAVAQNGRIMVRTSTPNAQVFIDGRPVGPSPYTRDDMPAGDYNVTIRAQGFDDRSERCTVSTAQACDINLPLTRALGRAALHVELTHPTRTPAMVLIDGTPMGEIGAGRDIPNLTATSHEIRVQAEGYADFVETPTLAENENHRTLVDLRVARRGLSREELSLRRTAISTWGGMPLWRGDVALDVMAAYGAYPLEVRGTTGVGNAGVVGIDAGFSVRTMFYYWELELRGRAGLRLADGLFGLGIDVRPFAGLGGSGQNNYGLSGFLVASLHSTVTPDEAAEDANAGINRFGSFALSLHLGFEAIHDGLTGMRQQKASWPFNQDGNAFDYTLCQSDSPSGGVVPTGYTAAQLDCPVRADPNGRDFYIINGDQNLFRPIAGVAIEFGLGRNWNAFINVDRVLGDKPNYRRALYQSFWGGSDSLTYIRAGLTYKF